MRIFAFCGIVIVGATGLIWAAARCLFGLSLNSEIKPVEVATLAVNIIIAILIQYYFVSRHGTQRAEKDLLINLVQEGILALKNCRDELDKCREEKRISPESKRLVLSGFRRLSNELDSLDASIRLSQHSKLLSCFTPVRKTYLSYKAAATGGGFPAKPYDYEQISSQAKNYRVLSKKLHALVFKINSS